VAFFSGLLNHTADILLQQIEALGCSLVERAGEGDWAALAVQKR
jgi:hypothetical protein